MHGLTPTELIFAVSHGAGIFSLANALFAAIGGALTILTTVAGVLLLGDIRADRIGTDGGAYLDAPVSELQQSALQIDSRYVTVPQGDELRRILLAHRFARPAPLQTATTASCPAGGSTKAGVPFGTASEKSNAGAGTAAVQRNQQRVPNAATILKAPTLMAAKGVKVRPDLVRKIDNASTRQRSIPSERLLRRVANVNGRWDLPHECDWPACRVLSRKQTADVIVLTIGGNDRNKPPQGQVDASNVVTPSQLGCRGPPDGGRATARTTMRAPVQSVASHDWKPRVDTAIADVAVSDDLGEPVPVGAAELDVIEMYLDDVLRDLLVGPAAAAERPPR